MVACPFAPQWLALGETAALLGPGAAQPESLTYDTEMDAREAGRHFTTVNKESLREPMETALEMAQGRRD
jgi:hypothetical protein